jgi:hypothetical protein
MAAAGPAHAEHAGHTSAGTPALTGLFLLYFAGYVLRTGLTLVPGTAIAAGPVGGGSVRLRHAPEVAVACRVTMALGMLAMILAL